MKEYTVRRAEAGISSTDSDYELRTVSSLKRTLLGAIPATVGLLLATSSILNILSKGIVFEHYIWLPIGTVLAICGLVIYRRKTEKVLTAAADQRNREADAIHTPETGKEKVQRYALAVGLLFGAAYFGLWSTDKNAELLTLGCLGFAALAAHEVSKWLLIIGVICAIAFSAINFMGIVATSPVAIAIIVGALIITAAVSN